jgi:hypothetical protein
MAVFSEGLHAKYGPHEGIIKFVCDEYFTLCVNSFPEEKNRDVCILIYRNNFNKVRLLKESEK